MKPFTIKFDASVIICNGGMLVDVPHDFPPGSNIQVLVGDDGDDEELLLTLYVREDKSLPPATQHHLKPHLKVPGTKHKYPLHAGCWRIYQRKYVPHDINLKLNNSDCQRDLLLVPTVEATN